MAICPYRLFATHNAVASANNDSGVIAEFSAKSSAKCEIKPEMKLAGVRG
jgi:hypothetical protein